MANLKEKSIKLKLCKMKKTLFTENQIIAMMKQHEHLKNIKHLTY